MQGASRDALNTLRERLAAMAAGRPGSGGSRLGAIRERLTSMLGAGEGFTDLSDTPELAQASRDLLAVAALLGREPSLRAALTDPGTSGENRGQLARSLVGDRIGAGAAELVAEAVGHRWSRSRDLSDALEVLGAQAAFDVAEREGRLDRVEDELFRISRTVEAQSALRNVLSDSAVPADRKQALLRELLGGRADATTVELVEHVVASPRGRAVDEALGELVELAAERRHEIVATVTTATPMTGDQEERMTAVLGRVYSRQVRLQATVDPSLVGGAVVRVGDEVIDGSVVHRLEQARRDLAG